jgi:hypothetical protein
MHFSSLPYVLHSPLILLNLMALTIFGEPYVMKLLNVQPLPASHHILPLHPVTSKLTEEDRTAFHLETTELLN